MAERIALKTKKDFWRQWSENGSSGDDYIRDLLHLENYRELADCSQEEAQGRLIGVVERRPSSFPPGTFYYRFYPISCEWLGSDQELHLQRLFSDYEGGYLIAAQSKEEDDRVAEEACQETVVRDKVTVGKRIVSCEYRLVDERSAPMIVCHLRKMDHDWEGLEKALKEHRRSELEPSACAEEEPAQLSLPGSPERAEEEPLDDPTPALLEILEEEPLEASVPELPEISKEARQYAEKLRALGIGPAPKPSLEKDAVPGRLHELSRDIQGKLAGDEELRLNYPERVIREFLGAMFSDQIIVLSGPPGTGKSSLPPAIAKWIGAQCRMVSVQPSWTDNQDLLGFYDPTRERFAATPFLDILVEAGRHPGTIYLVCLDEMNLVRVEYYFSEILSAMETKDKTLRLYSPDAYAQRERALTRQIDSLKKLRSVLSGREQFEVNEKRNTAIQARKALYRYPAEFKLPENIQFVGTLNMDETTRELSPKVLDRSFIIEVGRADSTESEDDASTPDPQETEKALEHLQDDLIKLEHPDQGQEQDHQRQVRAALSDRGLARSKVLLSRGLSLTDIFLGKILPAMRWSGIDLEEIAGLPALKGYHGRLQKIYDDKHQELDYWRW